MEFSQLVELLERFGFNLQLEVYSGVNPNVVFFDSPGKQGDPEEDCIESELPVVQVSLQLKKTTGEKRWHVVVPEYRFLDDYIPGWDSPITDDGFNFVLFLDKHYAGWQR